MARGHFGHVLAASTLMLVSMTGNLEAQLPINIAAGPSFSTISSDEFDTSTRTGFFVAVGTALPVGENVAIQPFVAFVQKGAKFSPEGEDIYNYIEIPVFLTYGIPLTETLGLGLSAGPQVAFNIKCNETFPNVEDFDCKEYSNYDGSTEFGLAGSAALQFPAGSSTLSVGAGFDLGLTDVFTDIDGGYKNRSFFLFGSFGTSLGGM